LIGYGIEDLDFVNRLEKDGGSRVFINEERYLRFIAHSNRDRLKNLAMTNTLRSVYLLQTERTEIENRILYLFNDNSFIEAHYEFNAQLKRNQVLSFRGWGLKKNGQRKGHFEYAENNLLLIFEDKSVSRFTEEDTSIINHANGEKLYWKKIVRDDDLFSDLVLGYGECVNRLKYSDNEENNCSINKAGWGKGTVYMNFDTSTPIKIE
jgi:hypothetical protein